MASIKDVAKAAGVSIATVSRAFNNYDDINEKTKKKIFAVAQKLNYSPNIIAKSLSSKKSSNIAIILSDLQQSDGKDNIIHDVLKGAYHATELNGIELSLYAINRQIQKQISFTQFCRERNLSGALLQGIKMDDPYFIDLVNNQIPCVIIDVPIINRNVGFVSSDNIQAMAEITKKIFTFGHQHIAILAGSKNAAVTNERMAGIYQAFLNQQRKLDKSFIFYADYLEDLAFEKTLNILDKHPEVTAIICMSDLMAIHSIRAIQSRGLRVPEDISVTGFDGIPLGQYITPKLTTIKQDFKKIAEQGTQLLIDIINKKETPRHQVIPYHFLVGESLGQVKIK